MSEPGAAFVVKIRDGRAGRLGDRHVRVSGLEELRQWLSDEGVAEVTVDTVVSFGSPPYGAAMTAGPFAVGDLTDEHFANLLDAGPTEDGAYYSVLVIPAAPSRFAG